ncbi:hypothetical protein [Burkholderia gladioli]|uniref:hypothetical protein n=1 Tax=Burkholderia gladioli TaxID=28095 RepID=UPI0016414C29|nr:hypothetical protein [Burkholderia gladioli]
MAKQVQTANIGELRIEMDDYVGVTRYIGTRVQLEAEEIIPVEYTWPDGYQSFKWTAGGIDFVVYRRRPDGAKGSRRAFFDCDNWCLRMSHTNESYMARRIRLMERELKQLKHFETTRGLLEQRRHHSNFCRAQVDKHFQAFKALTPCLISPPDQRSSRLQEKKVSHD